MTIERQSTPSLREFVEGKIDARLAGLRVSLPARVTKYDKVRQCVDVKPEIGQAYFETGERVPEELPIVTDVPVMFQGSGKVRITFPIQVGDIVLLVFASSSIARWKVTGKGGDPGDDRHHRLSDAIAIPGLISLADQPTEAPDDAVVFHTDNKELRLVSPDADDTVARQSDLEALVTIIGTVVDSAGANAALKTALDLAYSGTGWPNCTSKVKAK